MESRFDHAARIRRAVPDDARAIAELSRQLGYPSTPEEVASRLEKLSSSALDAVFVATREVDDARASVRGGRARVIAWLHVIGRTMIESAPYAEIGGLVVHESERARGVGRALVAKAESCAAARGYATIRVRSNVVREAAHRFYSARGYRTSKTQTVFVKKLC
jgi:GNAT superfamily N-acetyltransferase